MASVGAMLVDSAYAGSMLLTPSSMQVVDKDSAFLGLPNEVAVGVAGANHSTMCKFHDIDSEKYSLVWGAIQTISDRIASCSVPCIST